MNTEYQDISSETVELVLDTIKDLYKGKGKNASKSTRTTTQTRIQKIGSETHITKITSEEDFEGYTFKNFFDLAYKRNPEITTEELRNVLNLMETKGVLETNRLDAITFYRKCDESDFRKGVEKIQAEYGSSGD